MITVDVEDWFQVENFKSWIPFSTWPERELRVEKNTHCILDLLDSIDLSPIKSLSGEIQSQYHQDGNRHPKATFFVLGWIAERLPKLVREISDRGHEVASHGFNHKLCIEESPQELRDDLTRSRAFLEDITGSKVQGYRAPSFSINRKVLDAVRECGYGYDSSYNSFALNPRYGRIDFNEAKKDGISIEIDKQFYELPISNFQFGNRVLPFGGGGYFRLFPLPLFISVVNSILKRYSAYLFYIHPWEVDPDQPRVKEADRFFKFRHYINLDRTHKKLDRMIRHFEGVNFVPCSQYLRR